MKSIEVARAIRMAIRNGATDQYTAAQIDEVCKPLVDAARHALYALEQLDMKPMNCRAYIRELQEALAQVKEGK